MRILFTRFPLESAHGGAENQTLWLMEGLRKRGHVVEFLGDCPVIGDRAKEKGFVAHDLSIGHPPVSMWTALSFFWRKFDMQKKLMDAFDSLPRFDAVFMLSLSEKILLTKHAASKGTKVFWIEHDRIGAWLTKNPWLSALKNAAKRAKIVCVSELSRKMMVEIGFENIVVIPNGIPSQPPPPAPPPFRERGGLHMGSIARLSPEKGLDVLIHAIEKMPDINLTIIGEGKEEGYLRTLIREDASRIGQERIRLLPRADDLPAFYASLDAFVLPSAEHDPFGLVAAEAMALGVPTIVTDACGIAGYLTHDEDALIVEAGAADALSQALSLLSDMTTRERIGKAGAATAREKFSVERMVEAYDALFHPIAA